MNKLRHHFINRELSWIAFNERVLLESAGPSNPLLERLKFVAISSSNLDEFFMVRVAGLKDQVKAGFHVPDDKTEMTAQQQLDDISHGVHVQVEKTHRILRDMVFPELEQEGIVFVSHRDMTRTQRVFIERYYNQTIFPVLTPMAIDASHPFPILMNKSLNLAVFLQSEREHHEEPLLAVVQVPSMLPRYIQLPSEADKYEYVFLEEVIDKHIGTLFRGHVALESGYFRITRNADMHVNEDETEDLLEEIEKELKKRKLSAAVRLEINQTMSHELELTLRDSLELGREDVYRIEGPLDLSFFFKLYSIPEFDELRFGPLDPQPPRDLIGERNFFAAIAEKDILLSHPYESFEPVVQFINQAADDPNVLAIKQTLYRVSGHSPIVAALARAAEIGKQVTVVLELKARFDEENNIIWAKQLEQSGCHVIYGVVGLKTHAKMTLVVRQEQDEIRRYVHLSTGNYNDTTARIYSDIGMFTAREEFGYDASAFFNHLTGYNSTPEWRRIVTAPEGLQDRIIDLIDSEAATSTQASPGHIIAKMNSLTSKDIIHALVKASSAGVRIDLMVRGTCCLRPGLPGVSENIHVYSIVGRFLEHSRAFYFRNDGDDLVFLSSADWMTRNMKSRVEILFPVVQDNLKQRVKRMLEVHLADNVKRYELKRDGRYYKVKPGDMPFNSQMYLYEEAQKIAQMIPAGLQVNTVSLDPHDKSSSKYN